MDRPIYHSYEKLLKLLPPETKPTYDQLLLTYDWVGFRQGIVLRDNYSCKDCGTSLFIPKTDVEYEADLKDSERNATVWLFSNGTPEMVSVDHPDVTKHQRKMSINLARGMVSKEKVNKPEPKFEVHHLWYISGALPWKYPPEWLVTLCDKCHHDRHFDTNGKAKPPMVVYKDKSRKEKVEGSICNKCGGGGYLFEYSHIQGGICFECWGKGFVEF